MKSLSVVFQRRLFVLGILAATGITIVSYYIDRSGLLFQRIVLPSDVYFEMGKIRQKTGRFDLFNIRNGSSFLTLHFPNDTVYINSAIVGNSTPDSGWDLLLITVWSSDISNVGHCCALYQDSNLIAIPISNMQTSIFDFAVKGRLMQCKLPHSNQKLPIAASIAVPGSACSLNIPSYYPVDVVYKEEHTGSIGICTKVAYGKLDGRFLIEWFEIHKYVGVDTVYTQIDPSLNRGARKVLAYYQAQGMLITRKFDLPRAVYMYMEKKDGLKYSNNVMAIMDCMEHLRGYTYVSVFDFDEFIIPTKTNSWKDMLRALFASKSDAGGFSFHTAVYAKDWGKSHPNNNLTVTQYLNRTVPMDDRPKLIFRTDRVKIGGATSHNIHLKAGYQRRKCPRKIAIIRHYRSCREEWNWYRIPEDYRNNLYSDLCWNVNKREEDTTMLNIASKVEKKIMQVRRKLFGS